jgi:hypothetical protein
MIKNGLIGIEKEGFKKLFNRKFSPTIGFFLGIKGKVEEKI